jgi:hypothetical protein
MLLRFYLAAQLLSSRDRPNGNVYDFIGGTYVHGIMNGEAVQNRRESDVKMIDIP